MARPRTLRDAPPETSGIRALTHDGRGIADCEGKTVFVEDALPGETVEWTRMRRKRRFDEARTERIVVASPDRVEPGCAVYGRCGGCVMQHMSIDKQLSVKQEVLSDNLERVGGVSPIRWLAPLMADGWAYRRRARLGVRFVDARDRVLVGFRERHKPYITDMQECPVLVWPVQALPGQLAECIGGLSIARRVPQVEVSVGDPVTPDGGPVVVLVLRVLDPPTEADRVRLAEFCVQHSVWMELQSGGPDTLEPLPVPGREPRPALTYRLADFDLTLAFEPTDFIQVNSAMNAAMVGQAVSLLDPQADEQVLDLYAGIGNFTLPLARRSGTVHGVEGLASLTQRAAANARANGIGNAQFATADLATDDGWAPLLEQHWDRVLLDPARAGAELFARHARAINARRVVYVSCNPGTLARDAGVLVREQGYTLSAAGIMNMFPHTAHVESIAVFDREGG